MKRTLIFTSSHRMGLTGQLTDFVCALDSSGYPRENILCVSGEKEQYPGLFDRLKQRGIRHETIMGMDEHHDFGRLVKEFMAVISSFGPDVVHVQTNWQLAAAAAARARGGRRFAIIYTVHGYRHNHPLRSLAARWLISAGLLLLADRVIMPSSFLRDRFGLVRDKSEVVPLGVDSGLWGEYSSPEFSGTKRMVFPAEFRRGKNQDMLIRAVRTCIDRHGFDDLELHLPGRGETLGRCMSLARDLGLEAKVYFPGFLGRQEMTRLYRGCQYAVVPSNVETFGLCIAEPYVLGRVVVSRRVGVAEDIITDGETGFFFRDEKDLPGLLAGLFADPLKCRRVSENAFANRAVLSWENICGRYVRALEGL